MSNRYGNMSNVFTRTNNKIIITFIIFLLLTSLIQNVKAEDYYHPGISNPLNIPHINYKTSIIEQGTQGILNIEIENRYNNSMKEVNFTIKIDYLVKLLSKKTYITDIEHPPRIVESNDIEITFYWKVIESNIKKRGSFNISAQRNTPPETYFFKSKLEFIYNGSSYIMKSRGYFTEEEWDYAILTAKSTDHGGINLTTLGINGVLPDETFRVVEDHNGDFIPGFDLFLPIIAIVLNLIVFKRDCRKTT